MTFTKNIKIPHSKQYKKILFCLFGFFIISIIVTAGVGKWSDLNASVYFLSINSQSDIFLVELTVLLVAFRLSCTDITGQRGKRQSLKFVSKCLLSALIIGMFSSGMLWPLKPRNWCVVAFQLIIKRKLHYLTIITNNKR